MHRLKLLLEHGAEVNVYTHDNDEHPYDAAYSKNCSSCMDILRPLTERKVLEAYDD